MWQYVADRLNWKKCLLRAEFWGNTHTVSMPGAELNGMSPKSWTSSSPTLLRSSSTSEEVSTSDWHLTTAYEIKSWNLEGQKSQLLQIELKPSIKWETAHLKLQETGIKKDPAIMQKKQQRLYFSCWWHVT